MTGTQASARTATWAEVWNWPCKSLNYVYVACIWAVGKIGNRQGIPTLLNWVEITQDSNPSFRVEHGSRSGTSNGIFNGNITWMEYTDIYRLYWPMFLEMSLQRLYVASVNCCHSAMFEGMLDDKPTRNGILMGTEWDSASWLPCLVSSVLPRTTMSPRM